MPRMLLCEPQEDLALAMREFFAADSYTVELQTNGMRILECLANSQYDVIILEMALHGQDGLNVIRNFRCSGGSTPILLLTGKVSSAELQQVFDAGADAYLSHPFELGDLAAHVRAMLRRPALRNEKVLTLGSLSLDTESGKVSKEGQLIHLFPMEFKLLQFLMSHPNKVFNTKAIYQRVWQKEIGNMDETVRTHIRTLRGKIDSTEQPSFVTTVRGLGYKTENRLGTADATPDLVNSESDEE